LPESGLAALHSVLVAGSLAGTAALVVALIVALIVGLFVDGMAPAGSTLAAAVGRT